MVRSRFQIFDCLRSKKPTDLTEKVALFEFADSIVKEETPLDGSSNLKLIKKQNDTIVENKLDLNTTQKVSLLNRDAPEPSKTIAHITTSLLNDELLLDGDNNKTVLETTQNSTGSLNVTLDFITEILQQSFTNLSTNKESKVNSLNKPNTNLTESSTTVKDTTIPAITSKSLAELFSTTLAETPPKISFLNDDCKVDLIFIIDTSQSVAQEFQKQLQFAVDLVC